MQGITDQAGEALRKILEGQAQPDAKLVRLYVDKGRTRLSIETAAPTASDNLFQYARQDVLVVDAAAASWHADATLDYCDGKFCLA